MGMSGGGAELCVRDHGFRGQSTETHSTYAHYPCELTVSFPLFGIF